MTIGFGTILKKKKQGGVAASVLHCDTIVNAFELHSLYYVHL